MNKLLADYQPLDSDDYAIALVQGRPYRCTPQFPQSLLTQDPALIAQWIYLWVRDTGEGIALANQQRIFERLTRATTRNHAFEGYGLGLSIGQAIAQAHSGGVTISSQRGQGATSNLIIPPVSVYSGNAALRAALPE